MSILYEVVVYAEPEEPLVEEWRAKLAALIEPFGIEVGTHVAWTVNPPSLELTQTVASAILYFGSAAAPKSEELLAAKVPILPVVPDLTVVNTVIPEQLWHLNCIGMKEQGIDRGAAALLEVLGLLPRQRRIFLSYKRTEARESAVQLADALSNRQFDVFLDTRGVPPAEEFQAQLWHRLCDCDVLLMLHTPGYFKSRWTSAEFGRALAKHIPVLRVTWPDDSPDIRTQTAARAELVESEVDPVSGRLTEDAIDRIAAQLENLRARSHAVRNLNLISRLRAAIEQVGGRMLGQGSQRSVTLELFDGRRIRLYPNVGVPTSDTLHGASIEPGDGEAAVAYDEIGMLPSWVAHLDWLGTHVSTAKWIKASDAAWQFADWSK